MTGATSATAWSERLADRSPTVQSARTRSVQQARVFIDAARRLIDEKGQSFTTHDLVKEAGVALQTFYRYFGGKDELLLAVIEDMIAEACEAYVARARHASSAVERLRSHVVSVVERLDADDERAGGRFIAAEHWRLAQLFPEELSRATRPYTDMLEVEIAAAAEEGTIRSTDPARDAWIVTQLVMSVFHHHSFSTAKDPALATDVWRFCLQALGGTAD